MKYAPCEDPQYKVACVASLEQTISWSFYLYIISLQFSKCFICLLEVTDIWVLSTIYNFAAFKYDVRS